jgi:DNA (cytosine-5)-methyltransferase 1
MAVEAVFGGRTVWHSEIDKAASKVLAYRWPDVPNLGSITEIDWASVEPVDVLCGGFPCQDVSAAGKRAGIKDGTRSGLWAVFADAIDALRPQYVIIENVRGLLSATAHRAVESDDPVVGDRSDRPVLRALGAVLGDLSDLGYDARWATVAAADVGAPHRRERVFIVATDAGYRDESERAWAAGWEAGERFSVGDVAGRGGEDAAVSGDEPGVALLPTPVAHDGKGNGPSGYNRRTPDLQCIDHYLPTPSASDGVGGGPNNPNNRIAQGHHVQLLDMGMASAETWGKYAPAIARWESLTRPAPAPTEPNKNGNPRLSAAFSEWLMGWPDGWVTDPDIGISRNDQLRIVGNGVCTQQAIAALRYLLAVTA